MQSVGSQEMDGAIISRYLIPLWHILDDLRQSTFPYPITLMHKSDLLILATPLKGSDKLI